jgi:hypothetical protein
MSSVHRAHSMILGFRRHPLVSSESGCETRQSNERADNSDEMKHVVMSGRTGVLLKDVTEAEIARPGERPGEHRAPDQRRRFSLANGMFKSCHDSQKACSAVDDEVHQRRRDHDEVPVIGIDGDVGESSAFHLRREGNSQNRNRLNEFGDQVTGMQSDE